MFNYNAKMSAVFYQHWLSCNYEPVIIKTEFLVLHYTALSLSKTLECFNKPQYKASSHLVIEPQGDIYELVPCLNGTCFKAWHAGDSQWKEEKQVWKGLNNFSIGVELVNPNGNLFPYTAKQYKSLQTLLQKLKTHYPALRKARRILGHEHIAGHRGKVDPGLLFNWIQFFQMNYSPPFPLRKAILPTSILKTFKESLKLNSNKSDEDWMQLNQDMEKQTKIKKAVLAN